MQITLPESHLHYLHRVLQETNPARRSPEWQMTVDILDEIERVFFVAARGYNAEVSV